MYTCMYVYICSFVYDICTYICTYISNMPEIDSWENSDTYTYMHMYVYIMYMYSGNLC